jgi:endonuclease/exonuclease/phosphatase family metal-dependent hydrolase
LDWKHRGPSIVARIDQLSPDVACLQEVEAAHWNDLHAALVPLGWDGVFAQKGMSRLDGCALLYRTGAASLMHSDAVYFGDGEEPSGHLALIGELATGIGAVRVVTTHLRWQAETSVPCAHIGYRQATELLTRLSAGDPFATVICGDFNVRPQHAVVKLLSDNGFHDAYAASPQWTCAPNGVPARIDYIVVSRGLAAVGEELPALQRAAAMPNVDQPSDHLPITARIERTPANTP